MSVHFSVFAGKHCLNHIKLLFQGTCSWRSMQWIVDPFPTLNDWHKCTTGKSISFHKTHIKHSPDPRRRPERRVDEEMGRRRGVEDDEGGKGGRRERIVYTSSQGGHHEVGPRITVDLSQEEDDGVLPRPVRRGLLWQQKDRFFSRWKERFFILTQVSTQIVFQTPQMSSHQPRITSTASRRSHQESQRWVVSYSRFYL